MQNSFLMMASACVLAASFSPIHTAHAQEKTIGADAQVTQTCQVQKRVERLDRREIGGQNLGSKYFVSKAGQNQSKCSMSGVGGLLEMPGFGWLKSMDFNAKANASTRDASARVLFNNPAGANIDKDQRYLTLTRESKFDATSGLLTANYHTAWQVRLINISTDLDKKTGYQTYQIEPNDTRTITDALQKDLENATANVVQQTVQSACNEMCRIDFQSAEVSGLNVKEGIIVRVIPDEVRPKAPIVLIEWPAYTLTAKFNVHAKTSADMRADFQKKAGN